MNAPRLLSRRLGGLLESYSCATVPDPARVLARALKVEGHATARGAVHTNTCRLLRAEALAQLAEEDAGGWRTLRWWRALAVRHGVIGAAAGDMAYIRSPAYRRVVILRETAALEDALLGVAGVALACGLPNHAPLVELSAVITYPGASAQDVHADISPSTPDVVVAAGEAEGGRAGSLCAPLVTCWLSLCPQGVTSAMGPTIIHPRTQTRFRARQEALDVVAAQEQAALYAGLESEDGGSGSTMASLRTADGNAAANEMQLRLQDAAADAATEREQAEFGLALDPISLLLARGDVGMMDCRVVHYGSAHHHKAHAASGQQGGGEEGRQKSSGGPRVVLNASWMAAAAGEGGVTQIPGFTYHRDPAGKHRTAGGIVAAAAISRNAGGAAFQSEVKREVHAIEEKRRISMGFIYEYNYSK